MHEQAKGPGHWIVVMNHKNRSWMFAALFFTLAVHMWSKDFRTFTWVLLALQFLLYPHLMYWRTNSAVDAKRAEMDNMRLDALLFGSWAAALGFPVWITFTMFIGVTFNLTVFASRKGFIQAVVLMTCGALIYVAGWGIHLDTQTSLAATTMSIACVAVYMLIISDGFYFRSVKLHEARTRLRQSEQALMRANQAQAERGTELSRFLAVASHDLRQPLHALTLYLGALRNVALPDATAPLLANMSQCVQIMEAMFLSLLDLSRLDAKIVDPLIQPFPIAGVLAHLAVEFTPQAYARGLTLQVDSCDTWVDSDAVLVEQMLRNLIANAVRYTDAGGITITSTVDGDFLRIAVTDTGIGICLQDQATVFDEYCQSSSPDRDRTKGLGLGLAIVRRLSVLLGSTISLVSEPGRGSTFAFALPQAHCPPASVSCIDSPLPYEDALRGKLIVVVDDEEHIRDAMRLVIGQWGCNVVTAASGTEAVARLSKVEQVPDALLCDYQLRLNEIGLDVIDKLRLEFNRDIPALLVTGDTAPGLMAEMAASGFQVLHKPVQPEALRVALVHLLQAT